MKITSLGRGVDIWIIFTVNVNAKYACLVQWIEIDIFSSREDHLTSWRRAPKLQWKILPIWFPFIDRILLLNNYLFEQTSHSLSNAIIEWFIKPLISFCQKKVCLMMLNELINDDPNVVINRSRTSKLKLDYKFFITQNKEGTTNDSLRGL